MFLQDPETLCTLASAKKEVFTLHRRSHYKPVTCSKLIIESMMHHTLHQRIRAEKKKYGGDTPTEREINSEQGSAT